MDFEQVLQTLLTGFDRLRTRYAAIGGFRPRGPGVPRATLDLGFLVNREDLDRLHEFMGGLGYLRYISTENVSHYRHPARAWGAVDFLHAFRPIARGMVERVTRVPISTERSRFGWRSPRMSSG